MFFLSRCVWGREDEAGLGAQCFIEILIVLRFRSEGEGRSNALPIANKGCNVGRDVASTDRGREWSCTDRLVWVCGMQNHK